MQSCGSQGSHVSFEERLCLACCLSTFLWQFPKFPGHYFEICPNWMPTKEFKAYSLKAGQKKKKKKICSSLNDFSIGAKHWERHRTVYTMLPSSFLTQSAPAPSAVFVQVCSQFLAWFWCNGQICCRGSRKRVQQSILPLWRDSLKGVHYVMDASQFAEILRPGRFLWTLHELWNILNAKVYFTIRTQG